MTEFGTLSSRALATRRSKFCLKLSNATKLGNIRAETFKEVPNFKDLHIPKSALLNAACA